MTTRKQLQAQAHHIIDQLTAAEPIGPHVENPVAYRRSLHRRIRGEHWSTILDQLEKGATTEAVLASLTATSEPAPVTGPPALPTYRAGDTPGPTDEDRARARSRIGAIRDQIVTRKQS